MDHAIVTKQNIPVEVQAQLFRHLCGERIPTDLDSGFISISISKVEMIKFVRSRVGCGLKEAKDYVDLVMQELFSTLRRSGWKIDNK